MALITNLVSYWKLDEASGTREDIHSTNDLTDNNTVGVATGKINDGADFEYANSEYLSITDASQSGLDGMSELSISCWFNQESVSSTYPSIVGKWSETSNQRAYIIANVGGSVYFYHSSDGGNGNLRSVNGGAIGTGSWYHVVGTFKSGTDNLKIYLNGSFVAQDTPIGSTVYNGTAGFQIGKADGPFAAASDQYFDGIIDEVGVWNIALTADEVTALYNSGNGLAYPFTSSVNSNFFGLM